MMVRNEEKRICQTTLNSIKDYCSNLVIYDTGSTDNTIQVVSEFCQKNGLKFHLKQGTFVDFSTSRNVLLDYCDTLFADSWLLLLDAHDELQNGDKLVEFVENIKSSHSAAHLTQKWWSGHNLDSYFNVRLVKTNTNWRYRGVVHEYIICPDLLNKTRPDTDIVIKLDNIILYQDRTLDDDKSVRRFRSDKSLLYAEYLKIGPEPRTLFYLAQSCSCLGMSDEAYKYYVLRVKYAGFIEEVYHSFYRLGELSEIMQHDWDESLCWYLKAYSHSIRAEPLLKIAQHYKEMNYNNDKTPEWHTCYMYSKMACDLIFPINQILFVNSKAYTYDRWSLLGSIAIHVGKYREGNDSCLKAIEAEGRQEDKDNLKLYIEKEIEIIQNNNMSCPTLIAASFRDNEMRTIQETNVKHDKTKIYHEVVDQILESRRRENRPLSAQMIDILRNTTTVPKLNQSEQIPVEIPLQQKENKPKQTRRDKLRKMINDKKK